MIDLILRAIMFCFSGAFLVLSTVATIGGIKISRHKMFGKGERLVMVTLGPLLGMIILLVAILLGYAAINYHNL